MAYDQAMNIIFAAASSFSEQTLITLTKLDHKIVAVLTQPDRHSGRGLKKTKNPIKNMAQKLDLPVLEYKSLNEPEAYRTIKKLAPDLLLTMAYGEYIPQRILQLPHFDAVNVHPSLLPLWRGASPIQAAILNGDKKTGICLTRMAGKLDAGPIFVSHEIKIAPHETAEILSKRLSKLSSVMIKNNLDDILNKKILPKEQAHDHAVYAPKIKKKDALITWSSPASKIHRQVKAFNPWPVSYSYLNGKYFRIWDAELSNNQNLKHSPGTIFEIRDKDILVSTGQKSLAMTQVQLEGRKQISAVEFARGHDCLGKTLGC
ncbi:MAG: methionyl-tRNA formyltransferase [Gammaproteobacteria bacterium]|nr:methionyl-tRNA formyltransferase [Gammaproteobacteria bacterium]